MIGSLAVPHALSGHRLAVVDVDGNGGQPPEIVEIAVLALDDHRVHRRDVTTWLVRPQAPISPVVTHRVHGIGNADVAGCPPWSLVAGQVADRLAGRVLVAHHASVEHRVLAAHLPAWRPPLVLDTLRLAKHVWPGLPDGYGLDHLITRLGPHDADTGDATGRRHRAGYDTWMTARLLVTLVERSGLDWPGLVVAAALPTAEHPDADVSQEGLW